MRVMNNPEYLLATPTYSEVTKLSRKIQYGAFFYITLKSAVLAPRCMQM